MKGSLVAALFLAGMVAGTGAGWCAGFEEIVAESSRVESVSPGASHLIGRLEEETGKILAAGHLKPFRVQYGEGRPRILYAEPWMMVFTLARAYPYLAEQTQAATIDYLRKETREHPPWGGGRLGPGGVSRQADPGEESGRGPLPGYAPTGTMLHALWLYGHNTGDWAEVKSHWEQLERVYAQLAAKPPTYETISGAIAMSRMARQAGDLPASGGYAQDAVRLMTAGLDFETFRRNAHLACSGKPDWFRGSDGIAFALFYLTPEVARYIAGEPELARATSGYADRAIAVWPLWWMAQAPVGDGGYFDEGSCAGPETRMMLFNYLAWVRAEPAVKLRQWVDVPDALIGDCYYLQNLVTAIEAHGQQSWRK